MTARLQDWLAAQAQRRPDATALVFRGESTTYGVLDRRSNQLARALRGAGCAPGDRVALLLPKSPLAIAAMFATLKADSVYVPLDTGSPPERIKRILDVCHCKLLLAEASTAPLLNRILERGLPAETRIAWLDEGPAGGAPCPSAFFRTGCHLLPDGPLTPRLAFGQDGKVPAHILFTSGSTGAPKGVVITHSNVIHFVEWANGYFGLDSSDRLSGHPPLHFDLSTFDVYGAIAAGAQLHLVPPELNMLPHRIAEFIRDSRLTQWFSAPSALLPLAKFDMVKPGDFASLRRLLWCGEKFPVPALIYWMRRLPHVAFVNLYGPTEATIASSFYRVSAVPREEMCEIPVGQPCDGETLHVLDDQLRPAPPGKIGDLYIGGVGLSPGYWNDPEKTAAAFIRDPFSDDPEARIYRTGDLAKRGEDGLVYLIGRADSQIKLRGHRIELGEIEAAIHAASGIQDAAVISTDGDGMESREICCAYLPHPSCGFSPAQLKKALLEVLPRYMIPARWLVLDRMPHNANGKVDRVLLKRWFSEKRDGGQTIPAIQDSAAGYSRNLSGDSTL